MGRDYRLSCNYSNARLTYTVAVYNACAENQLSTGIFVLYHKPNLNGTFIIGNACHAKSAILIIMTEFI